MTSYHNIRPLVLGLMAWVLLLGTLSSPRPVQAQTPAHAAPLHVQSAEAGLRVTWQAGVQAASGEAGLPHQVYGGYWLPLQTQLVEFPAAAEGSTAAAIQVHDLASAPYTGPLPPAPEELPPALDWEPLPGIAPAGEPRLPDAPVFILHQGLQRGRHLATLAFSPIYRDPASGEVRYATQLDATVAGAAAVTDPLADATAAPDNAALFAPVAALASAPGPTNPLAGRNGVVKLHVTQPGLQEVTIAQLNAAGLAAPVLDNLRLYRDGVEVPLHVLTDGAARLRFYAETAGDRWNDATIYWLAQESSPGARMASRNVTPGDAPLRTTALEPGRRIDNTIYQSSVPGPDGDRWFAYVLDTQPNPNTLPTNSNFSLTLPRRFPNASAEDLDGQLTLHVTATDARRVVSSINISQTHLLQVGLGTEVITDHAGDWVVDFLLGAAQNFTRTFTFDQGASNLTVNLLAGPERHRVLVDAVEFLLPAQLDFQHQGGIFQGVSGTWRYQVSNLPTATVLYDITDPAAPQRLTGLAGVFQDGPDARRYLLAGPGITHVPEIVAHTPVFFAANASAHTVYIAPQEFHATLEPLVELRRSQRYQTRVIDVRHIYDAWSFGKVDPAAIRAFLRFAVGNWNPAPIAAILVGDGTWDPHDYLGFGSVNIMPPYLADVDPWLGETACESCFGQLDGDDPLQESAFMTDIWIGRFPVNNATELAAVVAKIVDYETDPQQMAPWRSRALHFVDDYVRPDGSIDGAGNFWASVERLSEPLQTVQDGESRGLQPPRLRIIHHYFLGENALANLKASSYYTLLNPTLQEALVAWVERIRPQASSDVAVTQQRTVAHMNSGVGLVTYTGHANHYYYATLYQLPDGFFNLNDVARLNNRQSPFIMLSMTCYTSQFTKPERRPITLDEHLFIHPNGGAIAVWGPAGLSVATGHDKLQEGFYQKLWNAPAQQAKLGSLVQAGHTLVSASAANLDVNKTFLLMGDPLTPARVAELDHLWLPTVNR